MPAQISVKLDQRGSGELTKFLKRLTSSKPGSLLHTLAEKIRSAMIEATPRDTGLAKATWGQIEQHSGGLSFANPQAYAIPLQFGSKPGEPPWPGVGPKTVMHGGRIFSSQAPGGMVETVNLDKIIEACLNEFFKDGL